MWRGLAAQQRDQSVTCRGAEVVNAAWRHCLRVIPRQTQAIDRNLLLLRRELGEIGVEAGARQALVEARVVAQSAGGVQQRSVVEPLVHHLAHDGCLGSISEIFDGEAPYTPRGCFAQAWSVAELARVWIEEDL